VTTRAQPKTLAHRWLAVLRLIALSALAAYPLYLLIALLSSRIDALPTSGRDIGLLLGLALLVTVVSLWRAHDRLSERDRRGSEGAEGASRRDA
jgi:hypothetical protein